MATENGQACAWDDRQVLAIHRNAYPIDTHLDTLYLTRVGGYDFWKGDWVTAREPLSIRIIKKTTPKGMNSPHCQHVSGPDFLQGGYGGACFSAHALWENLISSPFRDPFREWQKHRAYVHRVVAESHGALRLARTPDEVQNARAEGVACAILSVEGAHVLGASGRRTRTLRLSRLEQIAAEGAAYITLNHFSHTDICEAGFQPMNPWRHTARGGLSAFGTLFVDRCIDLGLMIDVSHSRSKAIVDIAEQCQRRNAPLLASHAAARSITSSGTPSRSKHLARAFTDDAIRAIVETGGTISVILSPYYLKDAPLADGRPDRDADLAFVVNYYERLAAMIARMDVTADPWDHLSFGSDFDGGISSIPIGTRTGADLPNFTRAMLEAGWPQERICRVYSGNFLRVWEATRRAAIGA